MNAPLRCPDCGTPLPRNAPGGLCPTCLLEQGFDDAGPSTGPTFVPGQTPPSPAAIPADLIAELPQFEFLELLGQGGMGTVYKARQTALDRVVAVKVMSRRDAEFADRFTREVRLLARLNHPHIVAVYDCGQVGDLCYFAMEYVDGTNLREVLRSGHLPSREALAIIPQMCDALQYAHDQGIVHRDIKPENLLLDRNGRLKVADFGLARLMDEERAGGRLTGTRQVMGTLGYMAPEQLEGARGVDHRADIYSLGVVFYELLTGELPLGRFEPPSKVAPVDSRLDQVVLRTLDRQPDRRYQHASDLGIDVEAIRSTPEPVPTCGEDSYPPSVTTTSGTWTRRWHRVRGGMHPVVLTLLILLGLGGGVGLVICLGLVLFFTTVSTSVTPNSPLVSGETSGTPITPLQVAITAGDLAAVDRSLAHGADPNQRTVQGTTALGLAASSGNVSIVRTLCDAGAVVDDPTSKGVTALMLAAYRGHVAVVEALLDAGGAIDARNDEGLTALDEAVAGGRQPVVDRLLVRQATRTANLVLWQAWQQVRANRHQQALAMLRQEADLIENSTAPVRFRIDDWQYDARNARLLLLLLLIECGQKAGDPLIATEAATIGAQLQSVSGNPPRVDLYTRNQLSPRALATFQNDPDHLYFESVHVAPAWFSKIQQNPAAPIQVEVTYKVQQTHGGGTRRDWGQRTETRVIR